MIGPAHCVRFAVLVSAATMYYPAALAEIVLEPEQSAEFFVTSETNPEFLKLFEDMGITPTAKVHDLIPNALQVPANVAELVRLAKAELLHRSTQSSTRGAAVFTLGLLYLHGIEFTKQPKRALELFVRARLLGNQQAGIALAWCLIDGCERGKNLGLFDKYQPVIARVNLGRTEYFNYLVQKAKGPPQTEILPPAASDALARAVKYNDRFARVEAGLRAVQKNDLAQATLHFEEASKLGSDVAKRNLRNVQRISDLHSNKSAAFSTVNPNAEAAQLFTQAQNLHRQGTSVTDYLQAIEGYRHAANKGDVRAVRILGLIMSKPSSTGGIDIVWMKQISHIDPQPTLGYYTAPSGIIFENEQSPLVDFIPPQFLLKPSTK